MPPVSHLIPRLHLASQSPRRRRMMAWLGIPFATTYTDVDETPLPGEAPVHLAARLAGQKAKATACTGTPDHILTADTVVDLDGVSLGKPVDGTEATAMLERLRERPHQVHTGVALAGPAGDVHVRRVTSDVRMRPYAQEEIAAYVATGDPMDKAGAYAIQHAGFHPVAQVDVCYANVVGLPLCAVLALLQRTGWVIRVDMPALCYLHFGYRCPCPDPGVEVPER